MEITRSLRGDFLLLTPQGTRLDAAAALPFKEAMRKALAGHGGRVLIDMGPVDYLDSSGLGAVVAVMKSLAPNRRLELSGLTPNVAKVFQLTRMDTVFRIHPDLEAAMREGLRNAG